MPPAEADTPLPAAGKVFPATYRTALALTAILILAAALRLWRLNVLPPGLNHDEGVNALDVERIIGGWRPVFLPANNGREALFMYTQALIGAAFGVTPTTLRLTAALWGIATVGLTFGLARRWYGEHVGLVSAALLAVAFWHVVLSRVGLRAITAPAFYVGVLWLLAEALRRDRLRLYVLTGFVLGLAEYTYISARVLPVILVVGCLALLWHEHRRGRRATSLFGRFCITALTAAVTVLPEAFYFYQHPEMLIGRTDQVLVFSSHPAIIGAPITFQQSLARTFGMFWVAGDRNWLHNIAGLPVLDPLLTFAFLGGIVLVLRDLFPYRLFPGQAIPPPALALTDSDRGMGRNPALWLMLWAGALLAGSSVTQESPNYLRLTALMPAVAIVCALGLVATSRLAAVLARRWQRQLPGALPVVLLLALITGEAARTAHLYFGVWAGQGEVYTAYDTDIRDAAAASRQQRDVPVSDTFVQLDASAPFLYFRPSTTEAHWLREYSSVVALPPPGQPGLWIYSHFQQQPPLPSYLPNAQLVAQGVAQPGHPGYFLYRLDAGALAAFRAGFAAPPQPATFGSSLQLIGTRLEAPPSVHPGDSVTVLLLWRVLQDASVNFGVSVHLTDDHGVTWAQSDRQGMMRSGWRAGDLFVSRHVITVPGDMPPVPLQVQVSASLLDSLHQPAAVLQTLGAPATLATLPVLPGLPETVASPAGTASLLDGIAVTGVQIGSGPVKPGDTLDVTVRWLRTASLPPVDVAMRLASADGRIVASAAGNPAYGTVPLNALPLGRAVADPRIVRLPAILAGGPLTVELVATSPANGATIGHLTLGTVQAQDRPHNYTVPVSQFPLNANFDGQIALLGYDLPDAAVQPGGQLSLTLNWQALRTPARDYTVFVHLLDTGGRIVAQNDSQPAGGSLPTRGWLPREIVADRHVINLPATLAPGSYHLEVGWYDAATSTRLTLAPPAAADHLVLGQDVTVR